MRFEMPVLRHVLLGSGALLLWLAGCKDDEKGGPTGERICQRIGPSGGTVVSDDGVLSVAVRPEALSESTDVCIQAADGPPDGPPLVFGPAYRVSPDIELDVPASITYRHALPGDPTTASVGAILREDFQRGEGRWLALPTTRLEPESDLIAGSDARLSMFYGLLDDGGDGTATTDGTDSMTGSGTDGTDDSASDTSPTDSDSTTGSGSASDSDSTSSASTTNPSTSAETTDSDPSTTSGGSTGGTDTGSQVDCDNYPAIEIENIGAVFVGTGSEDIAMTGDGTFVGVSGNQVLESDATGSTNAFAGPLSSGALGLRFDGNGDLFMANTGADTLDRIQGNGANELYADGGWALLNGIYPDSQGDIWVTDTLGPGVYRVNADDQSIDTIADAGMNQPNGILFDEGRSILYVSEFAGSRIVMFDIAGDGTPGALTELVDLPNSHGGDGMTMDECGNLYVVNGGFGMNPAACRLDRIHLEEDGTLAAAGVETLAGDGDLGTGCSSAQFGFGFGDDGDLSLWVTNPNGNIYRVYVGAHGAPIPGV